ncbi:hypothetical protein OFN71_33890, partial [Escherichia coli]|nr:hypothetical protein [Escherichia coli]
EAFDEILKEFRKRLGTNDSNYFITGRPSSNDLVLLLWGEDADSKLHNLLDKITNISVGNFYINDTEVHLHSYVGVVQAHRSSSAK